MRKKFHKKFGSKKKYGHSGKGRGKSIRGYKVQRGGGRS